MQENPQLNDRSRPAVQRGAMAPLDPTRNATSNARKWPPAFPETREIAMWQPSLSTEFDACQRFGWPAACLSAWPVSHTTETDDVTLGLSRS